MCSEKRSPAHWSLFEYDATGNKVSNFRFIFNEQYVHGYLMRTDGRGSSRLTCRYDRRMQPKNPNSLHKQWSILCNCGFNCLERILQGRSIRT
ncbi:MAG TPA: hypothetical protein V6D50_09270 [Chroococcales cyanobacterium]